MTENSSFILSQIDLCKKNRVPIVESPYYLMMGLSKNFNSKIFPINGFRHPPEGVTTGWYIWSGEEFSDSRDFFQPVHVLHLVEECPSIIKFLGLPPGWRFLKAGEYEDVWNDESLLNVEPEETNSSNMFKYFKENKRTFLG